MSTDPLALIPGEFVTTRQAAELLGKRTGTVTRWCREGKIPTQRVGGHYRIPKWVIYAILRTVRPDTIDHLPYVRLPEAARLLRIKVTTLRYWCQHGKIPYRRVGKNYEISQYTLQRLLDEMSEQYTGVWPPPIR